MEAKTKKKKKEIITSPRIKFYFFLKKYIKLGNNIFVLRSRIKEKELKQIPFDIEPKEAIIIINDYIANNKRELLQDTQLNLF
jgi:hypothetical protein